MKKNIIVLIVVLAIGGSILAFAFWKNWFEAPIPSSPKWDVYSGAHVGEKTTINGVASLSGKTIVVPPNQGLK